MKSCIRYFLIAEIRHRNHIVLHFRVLKSGYGDFSQINYQEILDCFVVFNVLFCLGYRLQDVLCFCCFGWLWSEKPFDREASTIHLINYLFVVPDLHNCFAFRSFYTLFSWNTLKDCQILHYFTFYPVSDMSKGVLHILWLMADEVKKRKDLQF